jgi:hypothetical protein
LRSWDWLHIFPELYAHISIFNWVKAKRDDKNILDIAEVDALSFNNLFIMNNLSLIGHTI